MGIGFDDQAGLTGDWQRCQCAYINPIAGQTNLVMPLCHMAIVVRPVHTPILNLRALRGNIRMDRLVALPFGQSNC